MDGLESSSQALDRHIRLLRQSPEEEFRRQQVDRICRVLRQFLEGDRRGNDYGCSIDADMIRGAWSTLLSELGPGDGQLRKALLDMLPCAEEETLRKCLLDFLPSTMPLRDDDSLDDATEEVIRSLRLIVEVHPTALLPVLRCLSLLPMTKNGQAEAFQVAVRAIPLVSEQELGTVVRALMVHATEDSDAKLAWNALRNEFRLIENADHQARCDDASALDDPFPSLVHTVLTCLNDPKNGSRLIESYLQIAEKAAKESIEETSKSLLSLDMAVLLSLSEQVEYSERVDQILDSYLASDKCPFDALKFLLQRSRANDEGEHSRSLPYNWISPSLVRFCIFLLLAPVRYEVSQQMRESVQAFVLHLYHGSEEQLQVELVQNLLRLGQESASEWGATMSKRYAPPRKRKNFNLTNAKRAVVDSVNNILLKLAKSSPFSLVRFKDILVEWLTSVSFSQNDISKEACKQIGCILAHLTKPDDSRARGAIESSELMEVLQKLLFSSSGCFGGATGDNAPVLRGILLATELIKSASLCKDDRRYVKEWVTRVVLPADRRTVDPELGSPGLDFLDAWASTNTDCSKRDCEEHVFRDVKMILANTGLIQKLAQRKDNLKSEDVVFGYMQAPKHFKTIDITWRKTQEMIICVDFFLKIQHEQGSCQWKETVRWTYDLIDRYLRMGRENVGPGGYKGATQHAWRPHAWLRAAVEFPSLIPLLKDGKSTLKEHLSELCNFELDADCSWRGPQHGMWCKDLAPYMETLEWRELVELKNGVFRLALSIVTAISASTAVLRHSFLHLNKVSREKKDSDQELSTLRRLIQHQIMKIYHLRAKTSIIQQILVSLQLYTRRKTKPRSENANQCALRTAESKAENADSSGSSEGDLWFRDLEFALREIGDIDKRFFETQEFIDPDVLWACVANVKDESLICSFLNSLTMKDQKMTGELQCVATRLIELKVLSLKHLVALAAPPSSLLCLPQELAAQQSHFIHCLRFSCFLVDLLPRLRKAASPGAKNAKIVPLASVSVLASYYVRIVIEILALVPEASPPNCNGSLTLDSCLKLCCLWSRKRLEHCSGVAASVFEGFADRLEIADNPVVAALILDVLSLMALRIDETLLTKVLARSWTSLHTVYSDVDHGEYSLDHPFAFRYSTQHLLLRTDSKVLEGTLLKPVNSRTATLMHLGMLRHWGLLNASLHLPCCYEKHIEAMTRELDSLLGHLEKTLSTKDEAHRRGCFKRPAKFASSIPGLNCSTFAEYSQLLIHAILGATVSAMPTTTPNPSKDGPYHYLAVQLRCFDRVLDVFQARFSVLPRKVVSVVCNSSRHLLDVAVSQLHRCVDWRNCQPILALSPRDANVFDPGAMKYLGNLIKTTASCVVGRVLALCEFWQSQAASTTQDSSRILNLQYTAEKTLLAVKEVALSHRLPAPDFNILEKFSSCASEVKTDGSHQLQETELSKRTKRDSDTERTSTLVLSVTKRSRTCGQNAELLRCSLDQMSDDDDSESSEGFGVDGDWGDDDEEGEPLQLVATPLTRSI